MILRVCVVRFHNEQTSAALPRAGGWHGPEASPRLAVQKPVLPSSIVLAVPCSCELHRDLLSRRGRRKPS